MLQFGTPLTRGEMKQIKGGNCAACFHGDGTFAGEIDCSSGMDCYQQSLEVCPEAGCYCY